MVFIVVPWPPEVGMNSGPDELLEYELDLLVDPPPALSFCGGIGVFPLSFVAEGETTNVTVDELKFPIRSVVVAIRVFVPCGKTLVIGEVYV